MRAKLATDGIEDVGLMVTTAARFRRGSFSIVTWAQRLLCVFPGGPGKGGGGGEDPAKSTEQEERTRAQILSGSGFCKWFNVRMGFGFISMTNSEGSPVDPPLDVFVHQRPCFRPIPRSSRPLTQPFFYGHAKCRCSSRILKQGDEVRHVRPLL
ncbi:hypothetical protein GOODEAATRI_008977 [Goodea atripinnis]|uniref:CSD domain-containing protein n=1 Tax=Goodea atripinnis TaxID=208336 RepID=A0ABV0P2U6_9TELE